MIRKFEFVAKNSVPFSLTLLDLFAVDMFEIKIFQKTKLLVLKLTIFRPKRDRIQNEETELI